MKTSRVPTVTERVSSDAAANSPADDFIRCLRRERQRSRNERDECEPYFPHVFLLKTGDYGAK
jgi:hypothetical protein